MKIKLSKKQKEFIYTIVFMCLFILLVFGIYKYLPSFNFTRRRRIKFQRENFDGHNNNNNNIQSLDSIGSKNDHIENFLAYPNEQKFCPNIYNSLSSFWTKFPDRYGKGLMGKFCCTSCYYLVSKDIYCNNNGGGNYKLCKLSNQDITNLKQYYNLKENLDFNFPEEKLNSFLNKDVLKMKKNSVFYPIQIIMDEENLSKHETEPTKANQLYKDSYEC